jgi:mxaJ protein
VLASVALGAVTTLVFAEGAPSTSNERGEGTLRVCADPNNLPFSNERRQGFENRLAELIADELGLEVSYTWWAQRRGFARNTLNAGLCDVIMGVPTTSEVGTTTRPYYRSCYVFVTRSADALDLADLDDPQLHKLSIGLHVIGDDFSNVPPAHALAARGIIDNVRGYSIYGDYSKPDPPRELIDALVRNEIDVAIAWGPLGGYFARKAKVPLRVTRIASLADGPLPMVFDISIAVRRADDALRRRLDDVIAARRSDIDALLAEYGVPTLREAHEVEPY